MEEVRLRLHLNAALKSVEIRKAMAALERLQEAYDGLAGLSPSALTELRDFMLYQFGDRKGSCGTIQRAYVAVLEELIQEGQKHEQGLLHGLTGKPLPA